jgi:hypothetical protein
MSRRGKPDVSIMQESAEDQDSENACLRKIVSSAAYGVGLTGGACRPV